MAERPALSHLRYVITLVYICANCRHRQERRASTQRTKLNAIGLMMHHAHNEFDRGNNRIRGLWILALIASFSFMSTPAEASMILADESFSAEWSNSGFDNLEVVSGTYRVSHSATELPEPSLPTVRFFSQTAIPSSSSMGSMSSPAWSANGGSSAVAVLSDGTFTLPRSRGLNWLAIERSLDVPPAPAVRLSRPPQVKAIQAIC